MNEAICAIATAYGTAAISVIRTSGYNCIDLVNHVFKGSNLNQAKRNTIHYGYIMDGKNIVDEVMVSIFKAPKSFTAEDSVEISCHGGIYSTNRVLEVLLKNGFQLALPGEFTKRAFLNKRIDLTQAEAVMDIISASNETALKSATNSLRLSTKRLVEEIRGRLLSLIASIEVNIDYPEYEDAEIITANILIPKLKTEISFMDQILEQSKISRIAIHGITTAIVGKPNVGKSSILNLLLDEDRAIVSDIEGTTRDTIEGQLSFGGITLKLVDTAGIRHSLDKVEQLGIQKSKELIEKSELIILVIDNSEPLTEVDYELLELTKDKKRIIVANKEDLNQKSNFDLDCVLISAKNKQGIHKLEKKLLEITRVNEFNVENQNYFSNARHIAKLELAKKSLNVALEAAIHFEMVDMIEIDIKEAWSILGEITGDTSPDLLINELFSKFCLGK